MPDILLRTIQYHPTTGEVAMLLEHDFGSVLANTTEAALAARLPSPADNWGNDEALAEAQAWVDADVRLGGKGYVVAWPAPPALVAPAIVPEPAPVAIQAPDVPEALQ